MTSQLKDRVEILQRFYENKDRNEILKLTGSDILYDDLISQKDTYFWKQLCRRDFKKLQKLLTQSIGEGHFLNDSDEYESDSENQIKGKTT